MKQKKPDRPNDLANKFSSTKQDVCQKQTNYEPFQNVVKV